MSDQARQAGETSGKTQVNGELAGHRRLLFLEGLILIILGLGAIVLPEIAIAGIAVILGWLFLGAGLVGLVTTIMARHAPGVLWAIASALISIFVRDILHSLLILLTTSLVNVGRHRSSPVAARPQDGPGRPVTCRGERQHLEVAGSARRCRAQCRLGQHGKQS